MSCQLRPVALPRMIRPSSDPCATRPFTVSGDISANIASPAIVSGALPVLATNDNCFLSQFTSGFPADKGIASTPSVYCATAATVCAMRCRTSGGLPDFGRAVGDQPISHPRARLTHEVVENLLRNVAAPGEDRGDVLILLRMGRQFLESAM